MSDFSCYVTIQTTSAVPELTQVAFSTDGPNDLGPYVTSPPNQIAPGTIAAFQLQSASGPYGSEGQVAYTGSDGVFLNLAYSCPYGDDPNTGSATITGSELFALDVWNQSDGNGWQMDMPSGGHPVQFWVGVRGVNESPLKPA